jgi:hypothetical protein
MKTLFKMNAFSQFAYMSLTFCGEQRVRFPHIVRHGQH